MLLLDEENFKKTTKANLLKEQLDKPPSRDRIAELVDATKRSPDQRDFLVELLPEQNPIYLDRGTNQTIRLRGYVLAAFEQIGLPERALPYVLDALENGREAYVVAGAAKALRGFPNPSSEFIPYLLKAINNICYMDDALTFERYKPDWPFTNHTSALQEIFQTFQWLGSQAQSAMSQLEALRERSDFPEAIRGEIENAVVAIRASESKSTRAFISLSLLQSPVREQKKTDAIPDLTFEDQEKNRLTYA